MAALWFSSRLFHSKRLVNANFGKPVEQAQPSLKKRASPVRFAMLEPRVLFDAAMEQSIAAAEAASNGDANANTHNLESEFKALIDALGATRDTASAPVSYALPYRHFSDPPPMAVEDPGLASELQNREVVFVEGNLEDIDSLLAGISADADVHIIDSGSDGVLQVADILSHYENVSAVHIISHGTAGNLALGTANLNETTIAGEYAQALSLIKSSLSSSADLLIYGCNFADGAEGKLAVAALAQATGADVAASDDVTGAADLDGDWDLELRTGAIETRLFAGMDWHHTLLLSNTGTWTTTGLSNTNVTQGVTATIAFTSISPQSSVVIAGNETFNTNTFFANGANGAPSLRFTFNWDTTPESVGSSPPIVLPPASGDGGTATLTITFSQPVTNPVIHLDRLGGNMSFDPNTSITGDELSQSNSALFTLTTPGATLTDLTVPTDVSHFQVTSTTIQRTPFVNQSYSPAPSPEAATNVNSTAAGSVRVNGTFTTITFVLSGVGPEGAGGDGIEIGLALDAAPIAKNDAFTINEDTTLTGSLYSNNGSGLDSDPAGDALTVKKINGVTFTVGSPITLANGTLTVTNASTGAFTFVPNANYNGGQTFSYEIADPAGNTSTANVSITITPVNDAPVDGNETNSAAEDTPLTVPAGSGLLANSTDVDGGAPTITGFTVTGVPGTPVVGTPFTIPGKGDITINANGSYTFVPATNYNGPIPQITYTVSDGAGGTDTSTLDLSVSPVNDPPVDGNEINSTNEDTPLNVPAATGLLANVVDPDGGTPTITGFSVTGVPGTPIIGAPFTIPGKGDITINANGSYTFVPATNYNGPIPQITYTVSDGAGGSDTSTLDLSVTPVNDPPVDGNETNSTNEDTPLNVPAATGLLANVVDPDGGAPTVTGYTVAGVPGTPVIGTPFTIPGKGDITINANGSYTFVPALNYNGPIPQITYTVSDGAGGIDTSTLDLSVTPVNDPPVDGNEINSTNEDTPLIVPAATGLLANTVDPDGPAGTITGYSVAGVPGVPLLGAPFTIPGKGDITINADGSYAFTPALNFNGPIPQIIYTVSDGTLTDTSTLDLSVTPANDAPVDGDETNSTSEDTPLNVPAASGLLANSTDVDGGAPTITGYTVAGVPGIPVIGAPFTIPGKGDITINADGSYTFVPAPGYNGPVPQITYTISDGAGGTDTSTLDLSVTPVNDPPVDGDEITSTVEDTPLNVPAATGLLANAVDPDGPPAIITGYTVAGVPGTPIIGTPFTISGKGDITINADGSYTFTPVLNFNGPVPQITYTVSDGTLTDTSTLTLSVTPVNDAPVDGDETNSTAEDTPLNVPAATGLLANSTDVDGGTPAITGYSVAGAPGTPTIGTPFAIPGKGDITINADGSYVFTPAPNFNGAVPQITYTVSDGAGGTDTSTLDLSVTPVNDPPIDGNEINSTNEDTPLNVPAATGLLANVVDPDGGTPTITGYTVAGIPGTPTIGTPFTIPGKGDITISADGSYSFTPAPNYNGPIPQITYTVSDGAGGTDTSTLDLSVTPVNDAPVDGDETNSTAEDTPLSVSAAAGLLANSTDVDGGAPAIVGYTVLGVPGTPAIGTPFTIPGKGDITINADGSYLFTPAANYNGPIPQITYTVSDGAGGTDTSTLDLSVTPVNDAPVVIDPANPGTPLNPTPAPDPDNIIPDITTTDGATPTNPNVAQYLVDPEGDPLTFAAANLPPGLTMAPDGTISGTIDPNASQGSSPGQPPGTYLVTTTADDGHGGVTKTTVTYTVTNPPPVAVDDVNTVTEDVPATGNVLTDGTPDHDTAPDSDPLTVVSFDIPGVGTTPAGSTASIPGVGDLTINADGSYTFTPAPNYNGPVPVATYTISDDNGGTDTATLTLTITPVNDAPVIIDPANPGPDPLNPIPADPATIIPVQHVTDGAAFAPGSPLIDVSNYAADPDGDALTFTTSSSLPAGLTLNPDGTVTGTVDPSASQGGDPGNPGVYTITVLVNDGALSSPVTLVIDVSNPPPVANNDLGSVGEDGPPLTGNVITDPGPGQDHDTAPDSDPLTVVAAMQGGNPISIGVPFTTAGGGVLTLNAGGSYTFNPGTAYNGLDDGETATESISYTISDGNGGTSTATLTITIDGANDAPVIVDPANPGPDPANPVPADPANIVPVQSVTDGQSFPLGAPLVDLAPYVIDPDGETITFSTTSPLPAGLTLNPDGTITGTVDPSASQGGDPGHPGVYTLTVLVNDGTATTPLTVVIDVSNPPPVANDDVGTVTEDTPLVVPAAAGLLSNDSDTGPDSDPLTITDFTVPGVGIVSAGTPAVIPGVGTLTINPDGSYSFTPAPNYDGPVPVATYTISDGNGGTDTATLTLTITPVNDPPVVVDPASPGTPLNPEQAPDPLNIIPDITTTDGAAPTDPNVAQYFVDPEGDPLTFAAADLPPGLTMAPDGTISGTIDPSASQGSSPGQPPGTYLVTITADDGHGGVTTTTITYTVTNPPPVAVDDVNTVTEDTPLVVPAASGLLANDSDTGPDSDPLTITGFTVPGVGTVPAGTPAVIPGVGTLTINPDGSYSFVPAPNYDGPVPVATYTISDGNGGTDTATLTLTITPVNDAPVVVDPANPGDPLNPTQAPDPNNIIPDITTTDGASPTDPNVAQYFVDPEGDPLTFSATDLPPGLSMAPDGTITGTIDPNASQGSSPGQPPGTYLVTITADDGNGGVTTTTITYTVTNPPPVAVDDHAIGGTEDAPQSGNVLTDPVTGDHDTGPDSDPLTVTAVVGGTIGAPIALTYGSLVLNADGSWAFTPNALANTLPVGALVRETVTYTISDGNGGTDTATLTIDINGVNDAPTSMPLPPATGIEGAPLTVPTSYVFADVDVGDVLTFTATGLPPGLTIDPTTGVISGAPAVGSSAGGPYTIVVTANDGHGGTVTSTFVLDIKVPAGAENPLPRKSVSSRPFIPSPLPEVTPVVSPAANGLNELGGTAELGAHPIIDAVNGLSSLNSSVDFKPGDAAITKLVEWGNRQRREASWMHNLLDGPEHTPYEGDNLGLALTENDNNMFAVKTLVSDGALFIGVDSLGGGARVLQIANANGASLPDNVARIGTQDLIVNIKPDSKVLRLAVMGLTPDGRKAVWYVNVVIPSGEILIGEAPAQSLGLGQSSKVSTGIRDAMVRALTG